MRQMFSPRAWLGEASSAEVTLQSAGGDDDDGDGDEGSTNTPLRSMASARSAANAGANGNVNARLASFFAQKGSQPLNEIEMEGVRALLAQSASNSNLGTPGKATALNDDGLARNGDDADSDGEGHSQVLKHSVASASGLETPSFKPTYNTGVGANDSSLVSSATPKRRVFDYSGFPSPYRTTRLKSSTALLKEKAIKSNQIASKAEPVSKPEKKLSNTASALLSFIEGNEPAQTEEKGEKVEKEVDFSNPYVRTTTKKHIIKKKLSPLEQLEESFAQADGKGKAEEALKEPAEPAEKPAEATEKPAPKPAPQPQQTFPSVAPVDKYKPAKSSSLRESITVDDSDKSIADSPEQPQPKPDNTLPHKEHKPLFAFAQTPQQPTATADKLHQPTTQIMPPSKLNGHVSHVLFEFPNAQDLDYTIKDVDDNSVEAFKDLFTF